MGYCPLLSFILSFSQLDSQVSINYYAYIDKRYSPCPLGFYKPQREVPLIAQNNKLLGRGLTLRGPKRRTKSDGEGQQEGE